MQQGTEITVWKYFNICLGDTETNHYADLIKSQVCTCCVCVRMFQPSLLWSWKSVAVDEIYVVCGAFMH
jgi:hypothetical protein